MYFNRFDICAAYLCYMNEYHGGQGSKEYAMSGVFARLQYRPSRSEETSDGLEENAREIFENLVATEGKNIRDRRNR